MNNPIRIIIAILALGVAVFLILDISPKRIAGDFDVYYHASQHYLDKAPVYVPHHGIEEFKYLPLFALLFSPLAMLKEVPALYIWNILNIFFFYLTFYLLYRLKKISFSSVDDILIIVCLFALTGRYLFANVKLGQVNILLGFLMFLTVYLEIKKKDFWSGAVLALSLMIKFFPLLFLCYFILTRRFKIVAYTILMIAFFLLLPSIYTGFDLNLKYLQQWFALLGSSPADLFYSVKNYSLLSFFSWFFIARHDIYYIFDYHLITTKLTPEVYYAWVGSCFIFFTAFFYDILFVKKRSVQIKYLDYSCLFVCGLLFNPLAYLNALIFLVVPYFFILRSLFYSKLEKWQVWAAALPVFLGFILLMVDNRIFFKDVKTFYAFLALRPLMWTVILTYLSLWLLKSFFVRFVGSIENDEGNSHA